MRWVLFWPLLALSACARGGTPLDPDAAIAADVGEDRGDVAFDVDFDRPVFDVPPRDVVFEAIDDEVDVVAERAPDVAPARRVDHCFIVEPAVVDTAPGALSVPVRVAVFVAGVTSMMGRGDAISVDVGFGAGATQPLSAAGWTWSNMSYERDTDGAGPTGARNYDQYRGSFVAPSVVGEYAVAARARIGDGPYTACSLEVAVGVPYAPAFSARLTVAATSAPRVGYCNLQFPRMITLAAGTTTAMPIYGRVFANTVTNRGCTDIPTPVQLGAQWGHGPRGSFPSSATWTWVDGRYSAHRDSMNPLIEGNCANIEYQVTPRAPMDCAPRAYAWRFRISEGPWTYCRWALPAEGAPTTPPFDVYDPALAGTMTITGCL